MSGEAMIIKLKRLWTKFEGLWPKNSRLAFVGILAFALSSVYAITQLFMTWAKHPHWLYILPAAFVEVVTAFTIWQIVGMFHKWSRTNQTDQDKRFYGTLTILLAVLVTPSVVTSTLANYWEFHGFVPYADRVFPVLLGILCPLMAINCAILGAIPEVVKRRSAALAKAKSEKQTVGQSKRKAKQPLPTAKRREKVLAFYCQDLDQRPADLGKGFGVTAQTIRNDLDALAKQGKITYKDGRVSLRPQEVAAKP